MSEVKFVLRQALETLDSIHLLEYYDSLLTSEYCVTLKDLRYRIKKNDLNIPTILRKELTTQLKINQSIDDRIKKLSKSAAPRKFSIDLSEIENCDACISDDKYMNVKEMVRSNRSIGQSDVDFDMAALGPSSVELPHCKSKSPSKSMQYLSHLQMCATPKKIDNGIVLETHQDVRPLRKFPLRDTGLGPSETFVDVNSLSKRKIRSKSAKRKARDQRIIGYQGNKKSQMRAVFVDLSDVCGDNFSLDSVATLSRDCVLNLDELLETKEATEAGDIRVNTSQPISSSEDEIALRLFPELCEPTGIGEGSAVGEQIVEGRGELGHSELLPPLDDETGQVESSDHVMQTTEMLQPEDVMGDSLQSAPMSVAEEVWEVYLSEEGHPYHYNPETENSIWDCPYGRYTSSVAADNVGLDPNGDREYYECECFVSYFASLSEHADEANDEVDSNATLDWNDPNRTPLNVSPDEEIELRIDDMECAVTPVTGDNVPTVLGVEESASNSFNTSLDPCAPVAIAVSFNDHQGQMTRDQTDHSHHFQSASESSANRGCAEIISDDVSCGIAVDVNGLGNAAGDRVKVGETICDGYQIMESGAVSSVNLESSVCTLISPDESSLQINSGVPRKSKRRSKKGHIRAVFVDLSDVCPENFAAEECTDSVATLSRDCVLNLDDFLETKEATEGDVNISETLGSVNRPEANSTYLMTPLVEDTFHPANLENCGENNKPEPHPDNSPEPVLESDFNIVDEELPKKVEANPPRMAIAESRLQLLTLVLSAAEEEPQSTRSETPTVQSSMDQSGDLANERGNPEAIGITSAEDETGVWEIEISEEGHPFHYNTHTEQSTWNCPLGRYTSADHIECECVVAYNLSLLRSSTGRGSECVEVKSSKESTSDGESSEMGSKEDELLRPVVARGARRIVIESESGSSEGPPNELARVRQDVMVSSNRAESVPPVVPQQGGLSQQLFFSDWVIHVSDDGYPYHYNGITGESTWICPLGMQGRSTDDFRQCECIVNFIEKMNQASAGRNRGHSDLSSLSSSSADADEVDEHDDEEDGEEDDEEEMTRVVESALTNDYRSSGQYYTPTSQERTMLVSSRCTPTATIVERSEPITNTSTSGPTSAKKRVKAVFASMFGFVKHGK